jgi:hypothetical protein
MIGGATMIGGKRRPRIRKLLGLLQAMRRRRMQR